MAGSPVQGDWTRPRAPPREGHSPSPESSLTWCLAHLSKPGVGSEHNGHGRADSPGDRDLDQRSRVSQWRALVAIRMQHIKGNKAGIARFRLQGGLGPLLDLLKHPDRSSKTLDLALSILANCCTEPETRLEVRRLGGVNVIVEILKKNVSLESVQNRAARALGNLAMDPEGSALVHDAGGVPLLLLCVSLSSGPEDACPKLECAQSAARALLYLSDTPSNRLSLLTQGTFSALAPLIAPDYPQALRRAALRTLHELTRGCGLECARDVSRSGVLAQLGGMASGDSGKPLEELALKALANMCSQGCLRPLVGSLGVIQRFAEEVKKDPLKSGLYLKALCLCCKEAVNRAKVKASGGLEVLVGFLAAHRGHPLSRLAILACVDFVFDESAMEQLQDLGLVPLLVARLVEEQSAEKTDVSLSSGVSPTELLPPSCFDSFDFPPPEGCRKEDAGREAGLCSSSFLSLRSWLVSEGLISSEGDLLDSSGAEGDWGGAPVPPPPYPRTSSPNPESPSTSKKPAQPPPASHPSPSLKVNAPPPSAPPSSSLLTPRTQCGSSFPSSPAKTAQTPVSPSKFSSPHKKRQRAPPAACLTNVTLDAPPPVSRPASYHHPYHPEPWTPESPILLLLSRFSHAADPSAALLSSGVLPGLLSYLTRHRDPSSRCFRMLCRLSCNPNCLQALLRTGSVALIHYHLCQRRGGRQGDDGQTDRVKAKVKQLGVSLLSNLRVQCESGFGSGVLTHVMLSGSEADRRNCALSLPLICSNRSLLKKLLVDGGGLLLALQPLGRSEDDDVDEECGRPPRSGLTSQPLYFSLLIGCLSALMSGSKMDAGKKTFKPLGTPSVCKMDKVLPPPSKKPRLGDACPYGVSDFDLELLLDDGTRVPANREAVVSGGGAAGAGSEYFRALLRGGFGEARAEGGVRIKDVTPGTLLPVLHYLHGCRLTEDTETAVQREGRGRCRMLDALVLEGTEDLSFQETALGEAMIGACRFLVTELQGELEDLCVSLLLSSSTGAAGRAAESGASKTDQESVEDSLANRTSELELTGFEVAVENIPGQTKKENISRNRPDGDESPFGGTDQKSLGGVGSNKSVTSASKSKTSMKSPGRILKSAVQDSLSPSGFGGGATAPSALLPQVYWFSQRYSYPALGRACLSLLVGCQDCPRPFLSSAVAGDCLGRLAREADCPETLKRDLLGLATAALG
ncbi:armadillo repeat-containing protein 5 [Brachionichthys hirsutus]|uniref:armadillo repeat-containing protein 5 n=1 Tax=Brachionichthys hirsutus TaxID=412623 RepID=UPI003604CD11